MSPFISDTLAREVADRVYDGKGSLPDGWEIDASLNANVLPGEVTLPNGLYAYALKPTATNISVAPSTRILAFRGTEFTLSTISDLYADADGIGGAQFTEAARVVNQWLAKNLVDQNHIELVGHSLGGALVQWAINDTNLHETDPEDDRMSVTEIARTLDFGFVFDPSHLHFFTFNAPGITCSPQATSLSDKQSNVSGEHHVIVGPLPYVLGDPIHLLGGRPVGGEVIGHRVDFAALGELGLFTHSIGVSAWWNAPVDSSYLPPYIDLAHAHILAANFARLGNTDGTVDSEREAIFRLGLFTAAAIGSLPGGVLGQLGGVVKPIAPFVDPTAFANVMADGSDGVNQGLQYLLTVAKDQGVDVVGFGAELLSAIDSGMIGTLELLLGGDTRDWWTARAKEVWVDVAEGIANAVSAFTQKFTDTTFSLGQALDFTTLDVFRDAYERVLSGASTTPSLNAVLEEGKAIVEQAGQTIVIAEGRPPANPFDGAGFNPDAFQLPAELKEGTIKSLTIFLPYQTSEGGQRLSLALDGTAASAFRLVDSNSGQVAPQGGNFLLTIPEGRREVTVGVWAKEDVDIDGTLSLSATLLDAAGTPTHQTRLEATITLDAIAESNAPPANGLPTRVEFFNGAAPAFDDQANNLTITTNTNNIVHALGGDDYVISGVGHDQMFGEDGHDQLFGEGGDDRLYGGEGNDILDGGDPGTGAGRDYLEGGAGDDRLYGGEGEDVLLGETGNDFLSADDAETPAIGGADTLDGGDGNDFLRGGAGADLLTGGAGNDALWGDDIGNLAGGDDTLDGGEGNDLLAGGGGADVLVGGTGNDGLFGEADAEVDVAGNDILFGNEGNDELQGRGGDDLLFGGAGNDYLFGDDHRGIGPYGNDHLDGGDGDDYLDGGEGQDVLLGGHGNDTLKGNRSANDLAGEAGQDNLYGAGGNDRLDGGEGHDTLSGDLALNAVTGLYDTSGFRNDGGNDVLTGGSGIDALYGGEGDDVLRGDADNDFLYGDYNPRLFFGGDPLIQILMALPGDDLLEGGDGDDELHGGAGADVLYGGWGNDSLAADEIGYPGPEGNDYLDGEAGDDVLRGGNGRDSLFGRTGNDRLFAGLGITSMYGNEGNDYLSSGNENRESGDSILDGGAGNDTYVIDSPADTVIEAAHGGTDTIESFVSYTLPDHVENLTLQFTNLEGVGNAHDNVLRGSALLDGRAGNDTLIGDSFQNTYIFGRGWGQDVVQDTNPIFENTDVVRLINVQPGEVTVERNVDNLILRINGTTDQLTVQNYFTLGYLVARPSQVEQVQFIDGTTWDPVTIENKIRVITGSEGQDFLEGNDYDNVLSGFAGNDQLRAGAGRDVLDGGAGDDVLIGGPGDDIYLFGWGSGHDAMVDEDFSLFRTGVDTIQMAGDVSPADVFAEADQGFDLRLRLNDASDAITISQFFLGSMVQTGLEVAFADGTRWDVPTILNKGLPIVGTVDADSLYGSRLNDVIDGSAGDDILLGDAGKDTVSGGEGDDTLSGGFGVVSGGEIEGNGDGDVGDFADDLLIGGEGDDTYLFNRGDGVDTIEDMAAPGEDNRLLFGNGISQADLMLLPDQNVLTIQIGVDGDAVRLTKFDPNNMGGSLAVKTLQFADGSQVSLASLLQTPVSDGNDMVHTGTGDQMIDAKGGDDLLDTGVGNDTLIGGLGNDTLAGGMGDDTYVFNAGDGMDMIIDTAAPGEGNALVFGPGITPNDLSLGLGSLLIRIGSNGDAIHLQTFDPMNVYGPHGVETFRFADGTVLSYGQLVDQGFDLFGTNAQDTITGTNVEDRLIGFAGHDVLRAGAGADVLDGGVGDDTLQGGAGDDRYLYHLGDGLDGIIDESGSDIVEFGAGLSVNNVVARLSTNGGVSTAQVRRLDAQGNELADQGLDLPFEATALSSIDSFRFADGTNVTLADLLVRTVVTEGTKKNDRIRTGRHDDIIAAGNGKDNVEAGSGHDTVYAGKGDDTVCGQAGNDILYGEQGRDVLDGGSGDDVLDGGSGNDQLLGGPGNDMLNGGRGRDTIEGGRGDDRLTSGPGADTIRFGRGDGQDLILAATGRSTDDEEEGSDDDDGHGDRLVFSPNIIPSDLVLSRQVDELRIAIQGGSDAVTIQDWSASRQIDFIQAGNGQRLLASQVQQLIQAMATFGVETGLTWEEALAQRPQDVGLILAASWQ